MWWSEAHPISSATPASCSSCVPVLSIAKPRNRHMIITMTMNSPSGGSHSTPHTATSQHHAFTPGQCSLSHAQATVAANRCKGRTQGGLLLRHAACRHGWGRRDVDTATAASPQSNKNTDRHHR